MQYTIQNRCASFRQALGWSRERLAQASKVPVSAIYILERVGWAGTPEDRRIALALESATMQRLEATALLDQLVAKRAEDRHRPHGDEALYVARSPENAELGA